MSSVSNDKPIVFAMRVFGSEVLDSNFLCELNIESELTLFEQILAQNRMHLDDYFYQ